MNTHTDDGRRQTRETEICSTGPAAAPAPVTSGTPPWLVLGAVVAVVWFIVSFWQLLLVLLGAIVALAWAWRCRRQLRNLCGTIANAVRRAHADLFENKNTRR